MSQLRIDFIPDELPEFPWGRHTEGSSWAYAVLQKTAYCPTSEYWNCRLGRCTTGGLGCSWCLAVGPEQAIDASKMHSHGILLMNCKVIKNKSSKKIIRC